MESQVWLPQTFTHRVVASMPVQPVSGSTTWQDLTGTIASQTLTYAQYLGKQGDRFDGVLSSSGTAYYYNDATGTDDGSDVTAYAQTGALLAGDPTRIKYVDEVRIDGRATSASSLSVAISGNLGGSYQNTQELAFSVQSGSTQMRHNLGVSGTYFAMRLQSNDTGWAVSRIVMRARDGGESV
jgi:hypothetical protein